MFHSDLICSAIRIDIMSHSMVSIVEDSFSSRKIIVQIFHTLHLSLRLIE